MRYIVVLLMISYTPFCWPKPDFANKSCPQEATATVISLQGNASFDPKGDGSWHEAQLNENLCEGGRIWVKPNSRASLSLPGNDVLRLNENTVITLKAISPNKASLLDIVKGFIHFIARKPKEVKIESGIANAAPLGTEFAFSVDESKAGLWVYEGSVKFYNQHGSLNLKPGQTAEAYLGKAPQMRIDIKPQDAVNWALYYPPLLPYSGDLKENNPDISAAIKDFRKGRIDLALQRLDAVLPTQQTPYFYKVRGAMRLIVGQVAQAMQDIRALLANKPTDADALALQSVIALTQNRKDEAFDLANKATTANPQSATAYTALSYAEQGRFNLDKSLIAAATAVKHTPHDAMAVARKAELELSQGLISDSGQTAQQALTLDANLERTQTVMGFAHLLSMDTDEAMQTFNKAVELDSASPLARLGLGLAKIRDGNLEEGRRDIEIAAILDPNNSLIRSYLGKAYYEENRNDRAEDQFKLAKERDPKDPTPYFYGALKKQTENKPVAALHDLQKAVALNDNRAVYRSKQLLDNDLAIRNTSLARIYDDLGFDARATVEATKSLVVDPSNYSAHRFLSDTYVRLPRREIAQVSELLQSQLLQPLNSNPVQPHLSVKGLSTMAGLGSVEPSFKDFTSSFQRNRPHLTTSGIVGNNGTYGDEAVLSGIQEKISYSLGQYHFNTNGFRKDANITHNVYNAFLQTAISSDVNLQFEFRKRETEQGDIRMFLSDDIFVPIQKRTLDQTTGRAGITLSLTPENKLLGSFIYSDRKELVNVTSTTFSGTGINDTVDYRKGFELESQFLHDGQDLDVVLGLGAYNVNSQTNFTTKNIITDSFLCSIIKGKPAPCIDELNTPGKKITTESYTLYNYNNLTFPQNVHWTFGFSYELFKGIDNSINLGNRSNYGQRVNPKAGLQWFINDNIRFRGVYLSTIKRQLIFDQTIEPTQVAGFNQFYDDFNGSQTILKGVGLDANFGSTIFSGLEVTERNINLPDRKALESQIRAYFNWTPLESWAFSVENQYERYKIGEYRLETNLLPITLKYFDETGFFAQFTSSLVWQRKIEGFRTISTDFPIFGLGVGYRLPKKMGILSLDAQNLTNEKFVFQDNSDRTSDQFNIIHPFLPTTTLMFRAILNF
ncbi:FecR domain-containing protein [Methyloglobulus sp.]|uniref:tetratricopeptide repeat protein n=1 Tax=Methyloglobulus sp. TaxID=2518622 RepID=UPI0032B7AD43